MNPLEMFGRARQRARPIVESASRIGGHEMVALAGHWAEVRERWAVARKARGLGELLRDQLDLLPETRARLRLDHRERRLLLRQAVERLLGRV